MMLPCYLTRWIGVLNLIALMGMGTQRVPVTRAGVGMGEFFTHERVWVLEQAYFISMGVGMGWANPMSMHPLPSLMTTKGSLRSCSNRLGCIPHGLRSQTKLQAQKPMKDGASPCFFNCR